MDSPNDSFIQKYRELPQQKLWESLAVKGIHMKSRNKTALNFKKRTLEIIAFNSLSL